MPAPDEGRSWRALREFFVSLYVFVEGFAPAMAVGSLTLAMALVNYISPSIWGEVGVAIGMFFTFTSFIGAREHRKCKDCVLLVVDKSDLPKIYEALRRGEHD